MRLALALALAATPALATPEWAAGLVPVPGKPGHYLSGERVADYSHCRPEDGCGVKGGALRMIGPEPAPVLVCDLWQEPLLSAFCIPLLAPVASAPDAPGYGFTVVGGGRDVTPGPIRAPSPLRPDVRHPMAPPAGPPPHFVARVVPLPISGALLAAAMLALWMRGARA